MSKGKKNGKGKGKGAAEVGTLSATIGPFSLADQFARAIGLDGRPWRPVEISRDRVELVRAVLGVDITTASIDDLGKAAAAVRSRPLLSTVRELERLVTDREAERDRATAMWNQARELAAEYAAERDRVLADFEQVKAQRDTLLLAGGLPGPGSEPELVPEDDPNGELETYDPAEYTRRRPAAGYGVYEITAGQYRGNRGEQIGFDGDGPRRLLQLFGEPLGVARWFPDSALSLMHGAYARRSGDPPAGGDLTDGERVRMFLLHRGFAKSVPGLSGEIIGAAEQLANIPGGHFRNASEAVSAILAALDGESTNFECGIDQALDLRVSAGSTQHEEVTHRWEIMRRAVAALVEDPAPETSPDESPQDGDAGAPQTRSHIGNVLAIMGEERLGEPVEVTRREDAPESLFAFLGLTEEGERYFRAQADQVEGESPMQAAQAAEALVAYLDDPDQVPFPEALDWDLYDRALKDLDDGAALAAMPPRDAAEIILAAMEGIASRELLAGAGVTDQTVISTNSPQVAQVLARLTGRDDIEVFVEDGDGSPKASAASSDSTSDDVGSRLRAIGIVTMIATDTGRDPAEVEADLVERAAQMDREGQ